MEGRPGRQPRSLPTSTTSETIFIVSTLARVSIATDPDEDSATIPKQEHNADVKPTVRAKLTVHKQGNLRQVAHDRTKEH